MITRLINNETDYDVILPWWEAHQGVGVPRNILPPCGVVAMDDDGTPAAAGWLYMAVGVGLAWMSWHVTNPALPPIRALRALTLVAGALEMLAETHDYHIVYTETNNPALVRWMKARGFQQNHSGVTQLFKTV